MVGIPRRPRGPQLTGSRVGVQEAARRCGCGRDPFVLGTHGRSPRLHPLLCAQEARGAGGDVAGRLWALARGPDAHCPRRAGRPLGEQVSGVGGGSFPPPVAPPYGFVPACSPAPVAPPRPASRLAPSRPAGALGPGSDGDSRGFGAQHAGEDSGRDRRPRGVGEWRNGVRVGVGLGVQVTTASVYGWAGARPVLVLPPHPTPRFLCARRYTGTEGSPGVRDLDQAAPRGVPPIPGVRLPGVPWLLTAVPGARGFPPSSGTRLGVGGHR